MSRFKHFLGRLIHGAWLMAGLLIWAYIGVAIGGAHGIPLLVRLYLMLGLFVGVFITSAEPVARFFDPKWPKGYHDTD